MSTYQIVTKKMNVEGAKFFTESVQNHSSYYVFAAKHTPYANNTDQTIATPQDSVKTAVLDVYNDMIFGKQVQDNDVSLMIPRVDWISNTVYTNYDDVDSNLYDKPFYACVNTGSQSHVYKCLYNNGGAPSTVEPSGTDIFPFETPQDGYIWKYMYTANDTIMRKFATNEFIPIQANAAVTEGAIEGAIDIIAVDQTGLGYDNYLTGEFTTAADLRVGGSPYLYGLGANASSINRFYNGCLIKMTSGAAKDEYRLITEYYITNGQKIITLDSPFEGVVTATDTYEIYPYVYVFDTGGTKQTNCIARAIVSESTGNSISKIEVLEPGSGYRSATAVILIDDVVGVSSNASLRAIMAPPGGHGSSIETELGANYAGVSVKFIENETPLTAENDYRTVGLIKDPKFANVNIQIDVGNTVGAFAVGERILQYAPTRLTGSVAVSSGNVAIVGTNTFFSDSLSVGDQVLITDGSENLYTNVVAINSNTSLTISTTPNFTNPACSMSLARNVSVVGTMIANSSGEIFVDGMTSTNLQTYPKLVGEESFCTSSVNINLPLAERVTLNGRAITDNFKTFTQLTKIVGTLTTGTFMEDEYATQDSAVTFSQPSARVHSYVDAASGPNDILYVTNVKNIFLPSTSPDSDGVITGTSSGAQFVVTTVFPGDLIPDSGEIVFIENLNPISRSNTQTETIKLIIQF